MKVYFLIAFLVFGFVQTQKDCGKANTENQNKSAANKTVSSNKTEKTKFNDLPDGVKLTDEAVNQTTNEKTTVEKELQDVGAKYEGGKLVDKNGKEIKFYKPPVRGASQGFEEDERQRKLDEKELKDLKEKYTVIILYVNPFEVS